MRSCPITRSEEKQCKMAEEYCNKKYRESKKNIQSKKCGSREKGKNQKNAQEFEIT